MERPDITTVRRILALLGVLAGIAYLVLVWLASNDIRNDLLVPRADVPLTEVAVATVGGERIGLAITDDTLEPGVWGLRSETAYGIVGDIEEIRDDIVVRKLETIEGAFEIGQPARWDPYVFRGDPETALGMAFEPVPIPGELGANPAWFIDGRNPTWVVVVHGRDATFDQTLRVLPALVEADHPVVVISYRGDPHAAGTRDGLHAWGTEEWPDIEDAVRWANGQGAQNVAIVGIGMGAAVTAQFLHETVLLRFVRGVVFDSPVLSLEATEDAAAASDGIPAVFNAPAKAVARLRFNLEWSLLDHVARAAEFDIPILILQGADDEVSPPAIAAAFADAVRDDLVTLEVFPDAGHEAVWNADHDRYETLLVGFLAGL